MNNKYIMLINNLPLIFQSTLYQNMIKVMFSKDHNIHMAKITEGYQSR